VRILQSAHRTESEGGCSHLAVQVVPELKHVVPVFVVPAPGRGCMVLTAASRSQAAPRNSRDVSQRQVDLKELPLLLLLLLLLVLLVRLVLRFLLVVLVLLLLLLMMLRVVVLLLLLLLLLLFVLVLLLQHRRGAEQGALRRRDCEVGRQGRGQGWVPRGGRQMQARRQE